MRNYRLGIIGAGPWAQNYIRIIKSMPNVELVALCRKKDIRPDFIPSNCQFYTSWEDLPLNKDFIDGFIVATDLPFQFTKLCLENNISVMAEKPLLTKVNQIAVLNNPNFSKNLLVNYIHLFSPAFTTLKSLLGNKKIVRICSSGFGPSPTREHFSPLWDYGPHCLSMILSLIGKEPTEVYITNHNKTHSGQTYTINLDFDGIRTKSIVGNGTMLKSRYLSVQYEDNGKVQEIVYDDISSHGLKLNGEKVDYENNLSPLEYSITRFLDLIDGKSDERYGTDLTVKITKILATYEEQ